jgi:hypothetical protein
MIHSASVIRNLIYTITALKQTLSSDNSEHLQIKKMWKIDLPQRDEGMWSLETCEKIVRFYNFNGW